MSHNNVAPDNYLRYSLKGFNSLSLTDNQKFAVNSNLIRSIYINDDLSSMTVELQDNIKFQDHVQEIGTYLDHICFNLIIQTETDICQPIRYLEMIKHDGNKITACEKITFKEKFEINRSYPADYIYEKIVKSPTAMDKHSLKYERIFKTLHNPNLIAQFMSLYQFLMELLSANATKVEQRNVTSYFQDNSTKYNFVNFKPTRRKDRNFEEDYFTYIRNEIGHCEETNDLSLYEQIGNQISPNLIKNLVIVLNDVINDL